MEKNRTCRICCRSFSNGKAMGGHMRSHLAKLPLPPKSQHQQPQQQQVRYPNSLSSSSSSSLHFPPSPNRVQSYRSVNHDLGESDTESPRSMTRRRSKRHRKSVEKVAESVVKVVESSAEQVSSVSDEIFTEEDAALCLLMLFKEDKNKQKLKQKENEFIRGTDHDHQIEDEIAEEEEDEDESFGEMALRSKSNGKYKCETCKKVFRSYQALGGHKASHKKIKKDDDYDGNGNGSRSAGGCSGGGGGSGGASSSVFIDHRIYKCPFCEKVFDSGQALGGHKKVHFSYLGNNFNKITAKSKSGDNLLDLNLPAPEEDDEDGDDELELSQVYQQQRNG
ncbi:zinc finger protein ZAT9 [Euphorbia lathyris]|uniref:zinc finger protein ZAT9 n=1 Tax=Euphorbia lathyris TaxID=212925 RepID=UPI0033141681